MCAFRNPHVAAPVGNMELRHYHVAGGLSFRQALVPEEQPICQDSSASALAKDGTAWLLDTA